MQNLTTLVAGIRASGKLHIGHYLGLVKQLLESQNNPNNSCFYFIADLHGLTTPITSGELAEHTLDIASTYLALGIDPAKITFFAQNHVHEHSELAWIFNCITPLGELERMTQFKDKSQKEGAESAGLGLFSYPVLMAADILLYNTTIPRYLNRTVLDAKPRRRGLNSPKKREYRENASRPGCRSH
jgi:tryptophanyl-tRNA synthetase